MTKVARSTGKTSRLQSLMAHMGLEPFSLAATRSVPLPLPVLGGVSPDGELVIAVDPGPMWRQAFTLLSDFSGVYDRGYVIVPDGSMLSMQRSAARHWGYGLVELAGIHWQEHVPAQPNTLVRPALRGTVLERCRGNKPSAGDANGADIAVA